MLYSIFQKHEILSTNLDDDSINRFGSAIWLIGRSYSASPERRNNATSTDDGLGNFFFDLANHIMSNSKYKDFLEKLKSLTNQPYQYNYTDEDITILFNSVKCVKLFNEIIIEGIQKIDSTDTDQKSENKNSSSRDNLSFCSKFLHFYNPHIFFIKDTFSFDGAISLFTGNKKNITFNNCKDLNECTLKKIFSNVSLNYAEIDQKAEYFDLYCKKSLSKTENSIRLYLQHVLRAYAVARLLNHNKRNCCQQVCDNATSQYMPRLVDSILMRIK